MPLDYSLIKVVGLVESQPNTKHAIINAVGYLDSGWNFVPLTSSEVKRVFPSQGKVFAPGFQDRYKQLIGKCIFAGIMPSANDGRDEYVWDRENGQPDEFGTVIMTEHQNIISDDSNAIFKALQNNGLLETIKKTYVRAGSKLLCIDPTSIKSRFIKTWDFSTIKNNDENLLLSYDYIHYIFMGESIKGEESLVDIMPDNELKDWMVKEFLVKEWSDVLKTQSTNDLEMAMNKIIFKCNWPKRIIRSRIDRLSKMLSLFVFTYEEIQKFTHMPILEEAIVRSVEAHSEQFVTNTKNKYSQEIVELRSTHELLMAKEKSNVAAKISKINEEIDEAKLAFEIQEEEQNKKRKENEELISSLLKTIKEKQSAIKELEDSLFNLETEKKRIIDDFSVVKDVIQLVASQNTTSPSINLEGNSIPQGTGDASCSIESINDETDSIKSANIFTTRLMFYLRSNNRKEDIAQKLLGYLIHYKAILLPDNRILQSIIQATGRCFYTIQYVTPEWRSFADVCSNGLSGLIQNCLKKPNIMHYYVLQNINLSYLPCFLQPIVDMSTGLLSKFPNTNIKFPENLRILLTETDEDGLPLAKQSIRYFGCLSKADYTIDIEKETEYSNKKSDTTGFLSVDVLNNLKFTTIISTDYLSYINNANG